MDVQVINTGSRGNAYIIDGHILIDCGVPAKLIKPYVDCIDAVFISHRHGDHIKHPPLNLIARERPKVIRDSFYANSDVHAKIAADGPAFGSAIGTPPLGDDESYVSLTTRRASYVVTSFPLVHDVPNNGFVFFNVDTGERLIYVTDTETLDCLPDDVRGQSFNVFMIEGNWDEDRIFDVLDSGDDALKDRAARNMRHLSIQDMWEFCRARIFPGVCVYQIHKSDDFGTDIVDLVCETDVQNAYGSVSLQDVSVFNIS